MEEGGVRCSTGRDTTSSIFHPIGRVLGKNGLWRHGKAPLQHPSWRHQFTRPLGEVLGRTPSNRKALFLHSFTQKEVLDSEAWELGRGGRRPGWDEDSPERGVLDEPAVALRDEALAAAWRHLTHDVVVDNPGLQNIQTFTQKLLIILLLSRSGSMLSAKWSFDSRPCFAS